MSIPRGLMQFTYSAITEAKLEQLISRERLQSYSIASGGSLNAALQLYVWNCAVSGALYGPLQSVEIALRNSINRALVAGVSTDWPTDPKFLSIDARFARDIDPEPLLRRGPWSPRPFGGLVHEHLGDCSRRQRRHPRTA